MQQMDSYANRKIAIAISQLEDAVTGLGSVGLEFDIVGGDGTESRYFERNSNVFNELQCGSYAFTEADYAPYLEQ